MSVTGCLRDEHVVILAVLDCFESALHEVRQSGSLHVDRFRSFLTFFRDFADKCHHEKEETELFPALERNGIPRQPGPLGVMQQEHDQGRDYLRTVDASLVAAGSGNAAALSAVVGASHAFTLLLREHIEKEDECLFDMAENAIQGRDADSLLERFAEVAATRGYQERFARCRELADQLCDAYARDRVSEARTVHDLSVR